MSIIIRVQKDDFCTQKELERLTEKNSAQGAVVSFIGTVRSDHPELEALHIEHYPNMTEQQISQLVNMAFQRWPLFDVSVIHRVGRIALGENIVLVAVSSAHRKAAFSACDFIMDYLKMEASFWKKELYQGSSGIASRWVEAKESDKKAYEAWQ